MGMLLLLLLLMQRQRCRHDRPNHPSDQRSLAIAHAHTPVPTNQPIAGSGPDRRVQRLEARSRALGQEEPIRRVGAVPPGRSRRNAVRGAQVSIRPKRKMPPVWDRSRHTAAGRCAGRGRTVLCSCCSQPKHVQHRSRRGASDVPLSAACPFYLSSGCPPVTCLSRHLRNTSFAFFPCLLSLPCFLAVSSLFSPPPRRVFTTPVRGIEKAGTNRSFVPVDGAPLPFYTRLTPVPPWSWLQRAGALALTAGVQGSSRVVDP